MQLDIFDIAVIGGGASGLAAAIEAKRYGGDNCRVAVIEKNARLGKKILATGNGRCNLGNTEEEKSCHYHGSCVDLIEPLFDQFEGSENFFRSLGLICKVDSGRLYPYSNHAASVLDALQYELQQLDAEIFTDSEVISIKPYKKYWDIVGSNRRFISKKIIISCGGKAAPSTGSDGSFYRILKSLGHSWNQLRPALCPVLVDREQVRELKGLRVYGKVSICSSNNDIVKSDIGEIQFTDTSLSGICIFNLAAFADKDDMHISIDFLPDLSEDEVRTLLWSIYMQRSSWKIEDMLSGIFQKKLCMALIREIGISNSSDMPVYVLDNDNIERLVKTIKSFRFNVLGLGNWNQSQVTSGGIKRNEIKSSLESEINSGLFFSGEILDIAGECGGYNLAWAWCSGVLAAHNAVDALKGGDES